METGSMYLSAVCAVGGATLMANGLWDCYNGKTALGKCKATAGALALAGGVYSLLTAYAQSASPDNTNTFSSMVFPSSAFETMKEACGKVLAQGYDKIPALDLTKHVYTLGADFVDRLPRCDVQLTMEGYRFFRQQGLSPDKYLFDAALPNGIPIQGLIRTY